MPSAALRGADDEGEQCGFSGQWKEFLQERARTRSTLSLHLDIFSQERRADKHRLYYLSCPVRIFLLQKRFGAKGHPSGFPEAQFFCPYPLSLNEQSRCSVQYQHLLFSD